MNKIKIMILDIKIYFLLILLCFAFTINAQQNCELTDKIEFIKVIDEPYSIEISDDIIYGIEDLKLKTKPTLNGNPNINEVLDSLLLTLIPENIFRSDQYKIFEINFVITPKAELANLFLTSELFWFVINESGKTEYQEAEGVDGIEAEMAKAMMGYIELEKINEIKALLKSQKWTPGSCNDNPVNTLMSITLNDI